MVCVRPLNVQHEQLVFAEVACLYVVGGSENLNQYVHVFFALLVYCDLFQDIYANRLPVGYVSLKYM